MNPALLITASLSAGNTPHVALRDVKERTLRHLEGLIAWILDPGISRIVFAKNCHVPIRSKILIELAEGEGKQLECVLVKPSSRTSLQGKGFGEGDLVRQVIGVSELIRDAGEFVKITGKLHAPGVLTRLQGSASGEFFVTRSAIGMSPTTLRSRIYRSERGSRLMGVLKRRCRIPWALVAAPTGSLVDTRCYRVSTNFYSEVLLRSHIRVQDALGYTLERAFWDDLSEVKTGAALIDGEPMIVGTSGSLGTVAGAFSKEIKLRAQDVCERLLSR